MWNRSKRLQSSFELLVTLSFGLAILMPLVIIAFLQLASANTSLSAIESQQAASKLASIATLVGSEGPPAKQLVQISMPPNVRFIHVGNIDDSVGHEIIFIIGSSSGSSYITAYTPVSVSGSLGSVAAAGTYLINVSAQAACPSNPALPCVYISSRV